MGIPLAVSPSVLTPGLYLKVNLLAGAASPGTGVLRVLLLSPKASTGDLTAQSEIRAGGGESSAGVAFGVGSPGHLAAKALYEKYQSAQVDFGAPTAGATASTGTFAFTGSPTANTSVELQIAGETLEVEWNAGEANTVMAARVVVRITAKTNVLPVTATDAGSGNVTITGKVTGRISTDIKIKGKVVTASGTAAVTPTTYTALAGGSTDPDFTTILAASAGKEYHFILLCLSNTDAETTGATSNCERLITHINTYDEGLDAKLQTAVFCTTGTLANAKLAAIARNEGFCEQVYVENGRCLPCQYAAREVGLWLAALSVEANSNRIGEALDMVGSGDTVADNPTIAEKEDALGNGVSICAYDAQGDLFIVRPITTYSQDASGGADRRLLDMNITHGTYIMSRDIRGFLPQQFPKAKITKDTEPGEEPPPKGVIEERDIKTALISRLRFWGRDGVIVEAFLDEVIASGELVVQVNESDPTQVDIVIPHKIVPVLAKFGVVAERRAS